MTKEIIDYLTKDLLIQGRLLISRGLTNEKDTNQL